MSPFSTELRALTRLALPLTLSYAGQQLMSVVDTVIVGSLGKAELGGVGIGNGFFSAAVVVGVGLVLGLDPLIAQALGAGELRRARRMMWQGVRIAVVAGIALTCVLALLPLTLAPAGVAPATAREATWFLLARAPSLAPFLLYAATRSYLQALSITRPFLWAILLANLLNAGLGIAFVFGLGMGVEGVGLASAIATVAMMLVAVRAVAAVPVPTPAPAPAGDGDVRAKDPVLTAAIMRIGGPISLQLLAEVGVFAIAGVMAGRIGEDAAAAHMVAITLASMTFTVTLGIAAATAVRVGHAIGADGDARAVRRAGMAGLLACWGFMAAAALLFFAIPGELAGLLTDDVEAARAAIPLVFIAALFQLSDGTQCVAAGALRGAGDTRASLLANVVGHYAVGLPLSILLGFELGLGAKGLWWGLSAGLTAVGLGLTLRFLLISRKKIARA